jgi:protease PrsW
MSRGGGFKKGVPGNLGTDGPGGPPKGAPPKMQVGAQRAGGPGGFKKAVPSSLGTDGPGGPPKGAPPSMQIGAQRGGGPGFKKAVPGSLGTDGPGGCAAKDADRRPAWRWSWFQESGPRQFGD